MQRSDRITWRVARYSWTPRDGAFLLVLALLIAGCDLSHGVDGDDSGGLAGDGGAPCDCGVGSMTDAGPPPEGDSGPRLDGALVFPDARLGDGGPLRDPLGEVWDGYIESTTLPSGSDRVQIVFDRATGDGARTGVVVFGEVAAPGPVTDPSVGYPPGTELVSRQPVPIVEGFEYPITSGSVAGARVRASIDMHAVWRDWCALQTSYVANERGDFWLCRPTEGIASISTGGPEHGCWFTLESGRELTVDCEWLSLCDSGGVCACDAGDCSAREGHSIDFDFSVTVDRGDGTVTLLEGLRNVHLVRR
jgi:hypothetical protein